MNLRRLASLCAVVAMWFPSWLLASDTLLIHGHIYTGNPKAQWAQALAISGTRIDAVGSDQEILSRKQAHTRIIDLQGRTVIPGISNSHVHMWFGGLALHGFNLSTPEGSVTADDADTLVSRVKAYAASHPSDKVLFGRADFSTVPPSTPTRELLDRAVSDRPVVVHNTAEHALWLNGKALTLAGITDQPVADPAEEKDIIRDASGHRNGILLEAAMAIMDRALMNQFSQDEKLVLALAKRGFQIMTHTFRPDSSRLVVDTYEEVEKVNGHRDRRLRIEHADFLPAQDIPRAAKYSMIASMQPSFCCNENGANYDPKDRTTTDRWQSIEKSGTRLAFGSD